MFGFQLHNSQPSSHSLLSGSPAAAPAATCPVHHPSAWGSSQTTAPPPPHLHRDNRFEGPPHHALHSLHAPPDRAHICPLNAPWLARPDTAGRQGAAAVPARVLTSTTRPTRHGRGHSPQPCGNQPRPATSQRIGRCELIVSGGGGSPAGVGYSPDGVGGGWGQHPARPLPPSPSPSPSHWAGGSVGVRHIGWPRRATLRPATPHTSANLSQAHHVV